MDNGLLRLPQSAEAGTVVPGLKSLRHRKTAPAGKPMPPRAPGCSIPPLRDQPAALVLRHAVFLDRFLDRARLIWSLMDEANEFGRRRPAAAANAGNCLEREYSTSTPRASGYAQKRGQRKRPHRGGRALNRASPTYGPTAMRDASRSSRRGCLGRWHPFRTYRRPPLCCRSPCCR
jgi:hypothetical protein